MTKMLNIIQELIEHLRKDGKLNIFTLWKEIYPVLAETEVFVAMLGQPGSTAMDLYRDAIVRIEDEVYPDRKLAQSILKEVQRSDQY